MRELVLLDDIGLTVNLISDVVVQSSPCLSSLPVFNCPDFPVCNTSHEIVANKFIQFCFKVKDDYYLHTTALIVLDFGGF